MKNVVGTAARATTAAAIATTGFFAAGLGEGAAAGAGGGAGDTCNGGRAADTAVRIVGWSSGTTRARGMGLASVCVISDDT